MTEADHDKTTHFGFREVREVEKHHLVGDVFSSVADKYDLMNDLMSFGVHRAWKRFAVALSGVRCGERVLDVAAGSGDLARLFARRVGGSGEVYVTDINAAMLARARQRLTDAGVVGNVVYVQADAERLPFRDNYFGCVSIGFGLRNVTRRRSALRSMYRCLRPGGRVIILEFSRPTSRLLGKLYDAYSFAVLPRLGAVVAKDAPSYSYLVESIRKHPAQAKLRRMMEDAGFERVDFYNLSGGVVAVHTGFKF